MKVIIAGSRGVASYWVLVIAMEEAKEKGIVPSVVISGCARGVDRMGEKWAHAHGVPVEKYPADWARYGAAAGIIRNREMAKVADALVAVWDGTSNGTKHMIETARKLGLLRHVVMTNEFKNPASPRPRAR